MMKKTFEASLAALLVASVAGAAQIDFPAGAQGELTDTSVLPLDKRPTSSDFLNFNSQTKNPLALTVSNTNEFMLGGLRFDSNDKQRATITVADGTTVKLPNSIQGFLKSKTHTTFKGGTWDFCGTGSYWCYGGWNVGHYTTNILDGVTFTNVNVLYVSDHTTKPCLVLTNGTRVTAKEAWFSRDDYNISRSVVIAGGSTLTVTSSLTGSAENDSHCRVLVTGTGSKLTLPGTYHASYGSDTGMRVEKGGAINTGSMWFDYSKTCKDNFLEVDGGSFVCGALFIGNSSSSTNFQLRVLNGGSFDSGTQPHYLYRNAAIIVSNATFACGGLSFEGNNNHLRLCGPKTSFTWDRSSSQIYYLFAKGKNHSIELDDHADWTSAQGFTWTVSGSSCRLSLANGSTLTMHDINIGYNAGGGSSPDNEVSVSSGSVFTLTHESFSYGQDTRIVISNGTVRLKNGFKLGYDGSSGGKIVFKGTTPRLIASNYLWIGNSDGEETLEFDLSDGPYALGDGVAPAEVDQFYVLAAGGCASS